MNVSSSHAICRILFIISFPQFLSVFTTRVQLGHVHLFVMSNPMNPTKDEVNVEDISWEMAQDEISRQTELRVEKEAGKEPHQPKTKGYNNSVENHVR